MNKHFKFFAVLTAIIVSLGFSGCGAAKITPAVQSAFTNKSTVYSQINMRWMPGAFGQKVINTANYAQGTLIPVNSKIVLKAINNRQLSFLYKDRMYILKNNPKYTGLNISQLYAKYFSDKKVNLNKFTRLERSVIAKPQGTATPLQVVPRPFGVTYVGGYGQTNITKGMSKEAVIVARGYPPIHGTKGGTKSDTWKYWEGGNATILVHFSKNRVTSVTE